jgi:adenylyltransferase/sulfurtransferase
MKKIRNKNCILTDFQMEQYSRNMLLKEIGFAGQEKLLSSSVLVVGAGGLGSPAALYLAAAGVGRLTLMDFDKVDLTNLQRQILHGFSDIGKPKAISGTNRLKEINPHIKVDALNEKLTSANALQILDKFDFIVEAGDNFDVKFLVNDACVALGKPFSHAGVIRFNGQLLTVSPGKSACLRCVFPEPPPPEASPTCAEAGVLGAVAGVIGSMQAVECLKNLLGIGSGLYDKLAIFDLLETTFRTVNVKRKEGCPSCGNNKSGKRVLFVSEYPQVAADERCLDYRGGGCPLNFLRIQRDMLSIPSGELLTAYLDDGDPIKNVPRTLRSEGHEIIEQVKEGNGWKLTVKKK